MFIFTISFFFFIENKTEEKRIEIFKYLLESKKQNISLEKKKKSLMKKNALNERKK